MPSSIPHGSRLAPAPWTTADLAKPPPYELIWEAVLAQRCPGQAKGSPKPHDLTTVTAKLIQVLTSRRFSEADRQGRFHQVLSELQEATPNLREPNFKRLAEPELEFLYRAIDRHFLDSTIAKAIAAGQHSLSFRISRRMTSTGGCTTSRFHPKHGQGTFQIAIAAQLLAQTWANREQATVCGVTCHDMREGLCRIMEHELLHLCEMLVWKDSSCAQSRFKSMAQRLFGHRASKHHLLTNREAAALQHILRPGDRGCVPFEGQQLLGTINRIHKRATVLVPDTRGQAYSDGSRYLKYYVPLRNLVKWPG
ncbi:MAG: hypothetical protein ACK493_14130 [Planctomycetota bacterium]